MGVDVWDGLSSDQICDVNWVVQVFGCCFAKLMERFEMEYLGRHTIQDVGAILLIDVRIWGDHKLRLGDHEGIVAVCIFRFA